MHSGEKGKGVFLVETGCVHFNPFHALRLMTSAPAPGYVTNHTLHEDLNIAINIDYQPS